MENLFKMKGLKEMTLDYKNKPCDNLELEIIDAFYIYEYIIKNELPEIIKKYEKNTELTFDYSYERIGKEEVPSFEVHWLDTHNGTSIMLYLRNANDTLKDKYGYQYANPYLAKNKNLNINKKTFDILIQMFRNFINSYELGQDYYISYDCVRFNINAPLYQVIDSFYSEWQRIDYETKKIIEDYQEEYNVDRKVLLPNEYEVSSLKRKK